MGDCCGCFESFFDILLGIGALIAAIYACVNVATEDDWLAYFVRGSPPSDGAAVRQVKYWQDIAQYLAISGYFFNILVLIVVTPVVAFCKKTSLTCMIALLVLLALSSVVALFSNIAALTLAVVATNQFNSVVPSFMNSSLFSNYTYDLTNNTFHKPTASAGIYWHQLQFTLECCGNSGFSDYRLPFWNSSSSVSWRSRQRLEALAPLSCCSLSDSSATYPLSTSNVNRACLSEGIDSYLYNHGGCFDQLRAYVVNNEIVIIVLACFVIAQVLFTNCIRLFTTLCARNDDS